MYWFALHELTTLACTTPRSALNTLATLRVSPAPAVNSVFWSVSHVIVPSWLIVWIDCPAPHAPCRRSCRSLTGCDCR